MARDGYPADAELIDRFRPVFERIGADAVVRERERILPFAAVSWLKEAGFGALRVPREHGGFGASVSQLMSLLIELGTADSNLPQLLRGHFAFVETRLVQPDVGLREFWLREIAAGKLVGNAESEVGSPSYWQAGTTLHRDGDRVVVSGQKYYTTGSIFADWIWVAGRIGDGVGYVPVRGDADGVKRLDDWDGFGQRVTGSGTTQFDGAVADPAHLLTFRPDAAPPSYLIAFYQLVLLATLADIGRAAVADAADFVRARQRNLANPRIAEPRQDPFVQQVIGRIAGLAYAAESTVLAAASTVDRVVEAQAAGAATADLFAGADVATFQAQGAVIDLVLRVTTDLFEVGGASATSQRLQLDRHWRNARTVASPGSGCADRRWARRYGVRTASGV